MRYFLATGLLLLVYISLPGQVTFQKMYEGKQNALCNQNYDWATWSNFTGNAASGVIISNSQTINVTLNANFGFNSTPGIYYYAAFSSFSPPVPNTTVPCTNFSATTGGGVTTTCFSQQVDNPVLLLASVGRYNIPVTLNFSLPYVVLFYGSGITFIDDTTLIGSEGSAIIMFPGKINCVDIYCSTPEFYANFTWGLCPPLFPFSIVETGHSCNSVTLTASGGVTYDWNGGSDPDSCVNIFDSSGTYIVEITDSNGCNVITSQNIFIGSTFFQFTVDTSICQGAFYEGYNSSGTYIDTLAGMSGCDSIRTLILNILPLQPQSILQHNDTLISNLGFAGYQWYYNGNIIPGATNSFYVGSQSGDYNVISTDYNGCEVEAVIFDVHIGINEINSGNSFSIYPNPASSQLAIGIRQYVINSVDIYNFLGEKVIAVKSGLSEKKLDMILDISALTSGIYFVKLQTEKGSAIQKLVVE